MAGTSRQIFRASLSIEQWLMLAEQLQPAADSSRPNLPQCTLQAYNSFMTLYEFIESPLFSAMLPDYLAEDEYAALQEYLCENPSAGDLVRGSGGIRKLRWARQGSGKSGGVRVCYYVRTRAGRILLLVIYAKSARDSIPGHVLKALKEELDDAQD